jgi:hypothetical protein
MFKAEARFCLFLWTREKQSDIVKEQMFAFRERSGYGKEG